MVKNWSKIGGKLVENWWKMIAKLVKSWSKNKSKLMENWLKISWRRHRRRRIVTFVVASLVGRSANATVIDI